MTTNFSPRIRHGAGFTAGGKLLWINGESTDRDRLPPGEYQLGPSQESITNLRTYYVQYVAHHVVQRCCGINALDALTAHQRPRSSGERFLLYVASNCAWHREKAFDAIVALARTHKYKQTPHAGGGCHGSQPPADVAVDDAPRRHWCENWKYYKKYRFALTMENEAQPGYVTEKVLNAFIGGAIPIYYGTEEVFRLFNRDAFVFYNPNAPQLALDQIHRLETVPGARESMLAQPILAQPANDTLRRYFSWTDGIGHGNLKDRVRKMVRWKPPPPTTKIVSGATSQEHHWKENNYDSAGSCKF